MAELTRTRSMQDVVTKKKIAKADGGVEARAELLKYVRSHGGQRVIHSILIANNGMAATKSMLSMREWAYDTFGNERALSFVAMASSQDLDANAEFVRLADRVVVPVDRDRVDLAHPAAPVPVVPRNRVAEVVERAVVRGATGADERAYALAVGAPLAPTAARADGRHGLLDGRPRQRRLLQQLRAEEVGRRVGHIRLVEPEVVRAVARVGAVRREALREPLGLALA